METRDFISSSQEEESKDQRRSKTLSMNKYTVSTYYTLYER